MRYLLFFLIFTITACNAPLPLKEQTAMRLATPAHLIPRAVAAGPFTLQTFERMHQRHTYGHIYIGDIAHGLTELNGKTPNNPVALHMAAYDNAENLAYIAYPCQYASETNKACKNAGQYAGAASLSPTVIEAFQKAIDNIIYTYDLRGVHLIGYGAGGGVATILAAKRLDVLSVRTVAGVLDHPVYTQTKGIKSWSASLNPSDFASKIDAIPQWHFIGGQDDDVSPMVLQHYLQAAQPSPCVSYNMIQENEHRAGWVEKWPELLKRTPECRVPDSTIMADMPKPSFPISTEPEPFVQPRVLDLGKGGK